jgi:hypothetical protein
MSKYFIYKSIARQQVAKQVPAREILGKQCVARLFNNAYSRRSVFSVVSAIPSARQQNCNHVYNNRSCFL